MNREEEFRALMAQPEPERATGTLERAARRQKRRTRRLSVLSSAAGSFLCFVLLVNFCQPVANACARVPGLRELAAAVSFSRSLTDAVANEYGQMIEQEQQQNGITARVEHLIVDQKQVTVFYRLDHDGEEPLNADVLFLDGEGQQLSSCSYGANDFNVPNGQLQSATVDFLQGDVPERLTLKLQLWFGPQYAVAPVEPAADSIWPEDMEYVAPDYQAEFSFLLEFDPLFTETGRQIPVNETVVLDGQSITITEVEVYPSYMSVTVAGAEDNSAWMKDLEFYVVTDRGKRFDTVRNGISAVGELGSPAMAKYRLDSSYFYEAERLQLMITGATWLDKDRQYTYVDLVNGSGSGLPDDTEIAGCRRIGNGWEVAVRAKMRGEVKEGEMKFHQLFMNTYRSSSGEDGYIGSWSSTVSWEGYEEVPGYFYEVFPLLGYTEDEVWLEAAYSRVWQAEVPVELSVTLPPAEE